ncbi:hypothetical protein [Pseudorhodoferax sp.]|uniref:hypothetical protein n=1 Tax=Pseudorhodoferax sp. TaxID=1993553 RepID=UPI0039E3B372
MSRPLLPPAFRRLAAAAVLLSAQAGVPAQEAPSACPAPDELRAVHLYGQWRARWTNAAEGTTGAVLQLERHPELSDSVHGRVERDGISALLAGDVHEGDLTLEESRDGRRISATWLGEVVPDSCGKEIRGRWTDADTGAERGFVLRRQGGWQ